MNNYPNFSDQGYQIIRELGHNNIGGRVTYLAENIKTKKNVVIKQFQFAKLGATWAEYDAYEQEIEVLKSLQHPAIPQYLDSFQTADGFCMIQEYIDAESAATFRQWQPQDIKQIAISILEILVYLQNQPQLVIHRDIKPENILIDKQLNVYLVDFGFARMGGGEIAASSVVKGTMGFMSPEQMFNRQLTTASDLYSLGATLICLLTGIKSGDIGNLIDANYRIIFRHLVPPLQRGWINWLEKMAEPKYTDRYENAEVALAALLPLDANRLPKVRINQNQKKLKFSGHKWGEKLTYTIWISNPIPKTILSGRWEVAPHVSDPPHTSYDHSWISFSPQKFEGNNVECEITVDTSQLVKNKIYRREIFLHSNSASETETINIQVKTGNLPQLKPDLMFLFCQFVMMVSCIFGSFILLKLNPLFILLSVTIYTLCNYIIKISKKILIKIVLLSIISITILTLIISIIFSTMVPVAILFTILLMFFFSLPQTLLPAIVVVGVCYGIKRFSWQILEGLIFDITENKFYKSFSEREKKLIVLLTIGFYLSLGITLGIFIEVLFQVYCLTLGQIIVLAGIAIASLSATLRSLIYLLSKPIKIFSKYRQSEQNLIKP